jgi:hypothetical protein
MALQMIRGGSPVDIPTPGEVADVVDLRTRAFYREQQQIQNERDREKYRAVKWLEVVVTGTADGSGNITLPTKGQPILGPEQGYAWSVRRISVNGITPGGSAFLNLFYSDGAGGTGLTKFIDSLSAFDAARYASSGSIIVMPGRSLMVNGGVLGNNAVIALMLGVWEAPAERAAELWA